MQLDHRLSKAADYVREGAIFADVGCDHGYLSIYLVKHGKALRGYACDIREDPLSKAKKNLLKVGLENKIETRLTNGLNGLENVGLTDVVIAGIGGEAIADILDNAAFLKNPNIHLILQPMSKDSLLRRYLYNQGYEIKEEVAVRSGKYVYMVMMVCFSGVQMEIDEFFANVGLLPECANEISIEKMNRTARYLMGCSSGLLREELTHQEGLKLYKTAMRIKETVEQLALKREED